MSSAYKALAAIVIFLILLTSNNIVFAYPDDGFEEEEFPNIEYMEVLEVMVGRMVYADFVDVYNHNGEGDYYVNLQQYLKMVGFKIELEFDEEDESNFTAKGFFLRLGNKFKLTPDEVTYIDITEPILEYDIANDEGDLYIKMALLSKWFPIDLSVENSILKLEPREKLPFQEKRERAKKRKLWFSQDPEPVYKDYNESFGFFNRYPMAEIGIGTNYDSKNNDISSSFNATITKDIYPLNYRFNLSGKDGEISSLKIHGERNVTDEDALVSHFQFGDISPSVKGITRARSGGRGVYLTNQPMNKPSKFDATDIKGYTHPKWEVEVYKNNQLIGFKEAGDDGFYEFDDIPIEYGENKIRVVKFGPHGEIEEDVESYYIDSNLLPIGEFEYHFSLTQPNANLAFFPDPEHTETFLNLDAEYGFSDDTSFYYGTSYYSIDDEESLFKAFGFSNIYGEFISHVDVLFDVLKHNASQKISVHTHLGETALRFVQRFWQDDTDRLSKTEISIAGGFDSFLNNKDSVSYTITSDFFVDDYGKWDADLKSRIGTSVLGANITNSNILIFDENSANLSGNLNFRKRITDDSLKLGFNYSLYPDLRLESASMSWQHYYSPVINVKTDFNYTPPSGKFSLSSDLNYINKYFSLGVGASIDDELNYSLAAKVDFSLYYDDISKKPVITHDPIASSGMILASAFLDENYSGEKDEEEELIKDVVFLKGGGVYKADETGVAKIFAGGKSEILIDSISLPEPTMIADEPGYNVVSRAGVTTKLEFAITETSEIDGEIILLEEDCVFNEGTEELDCEEIEKPIGGMRIQLIDKEGKTARQIMSEYDGFYIMDKVTPGDYYLTLHSDDLNKINCRVKENVPIKIEKGSNYYDSLNIYMLKQ